MQKKKSQYLKLVVKTAGGTKTCYSHEHTQSGDCFTFFLCDRAGSANGVALEATRSDLKRKQVCEFNPAARRLEPVTTTEISA